MMAAGLNLGPYTLLEPIGAGGMGEVWKALDTRLGREVAIKVLPEARSDDADRLRRFEQEARSASALNHPNILTLLDVGTHTGAPFIVFELLEGETLRARLASGRLSERKAVECAVQLARGLAVAHDKGIVHRDLKPENLFLTRDGGLKILDFGLAKLRSSERGVGSAAETASQLTDPGTRLGTVGYMSPEQVEGRTADHRSDIFAFGLVLYEMLAGERAFRRATDAETLTAILREEAEELAGTGTRVSPAIERLVRRCLEKAPAERFQSARDLAFALEALSAGSGVAPGGLAPAAARTPWRRLLAAATVLAAALGGALGVGRWTAPVRFPEYELLTANRGLPTGARFTPDGKAVVYSVPEGAGAPQVFVRRLDNPEPGRLPLPAASILSVSTKGEAAVLMTADRTPFFARGTLARVPITGGQPRSLLEDVQDADWGPDGETLCVLREVAGEKRLEYPIGSVLARGGLAYPRVSPTGELVAFQNEDGDLEVVDRSGRRRSLGGSDLFIVGLAWGPRGDEVWFTGGRGATDRALWAIDLSGRRRLLARGAGSLTLLDVAADGRALVRPGFGHLGLRWHAPGPGQEREVATPVRSAAVGLAGDGRRILVQVYEHGAGRNQAAFEARSEALLLEPASASSVRLGPGVPLTLSPDGEWSLCLQGPPPRLAELPTGPGEPREVAFGGLQPDGGWTPAAWSADGQVLFVTAREPGRPRRIFARRGDRHDWQGATPEGVGGGRFAVSPDGLRVVTTGPRGLLTVYSLDAREPAELRDTRGLSAVHWSSDADWLYVRTASSVPAVLERLSIATGRREPLMQLMPDDPEGVSGISNIVFTPRGDAYAYFYNRNQGDLFLVSGIR